MTPAEGNKVATADKYITVDLQFTGSGAATRAIDADGFEAATEDENAVSEAAFLFFNGDTQVADPFVIAAGGNDANGDAWTPGDGKKKNPVIVMKNPTAAPTSLVVLINTGKTAAQLEGKKVADLQKELADFATGKTTKGKFVMSNSVYVAAGNVVIGAPVGAENIKETAEKAKTDPAPVKVYVERVVAKVTVKDATTETTLDSGVEGIKIAVLGWGFAYDNHKSYLIKNLAKSYDFGATWAKWTDAANFRSYWADAPYVEPEEGTIPENTSWDDAKNELDGTTAYYTQEHVEALPQKTIEKGGRPTAIVVKAALTDEEGSAVNLYKHKGILYKEDDFKQLMVNGATVKQYYKKASSTQTETTYVSLDVDDFDLNINTNANPEGYLADVNLTPKSSVVIYDAEGTDVTATAKAAIEAMVETVQFYNEGATYYYVPIVQNSALNVNVKDPDAETPAYWGLFGVVRNHFYQLTIKSIKGLGTAVPDPTQVIIPETPDEEESYIAAEINILDWKKVTQDVNLGE